MSVLFFCLSNNPDTQRSQRNQPNQPISTMTTVAAAALFKVHVENMPEALNTKKDVDEYCKQFWKDYKEKAKEAKAADKAAKAEKPKRKKGVDNDGNPKDKRPPSAYNIFVKEKRAEVKEANPDMDNKEILTEIARLWKAQKGENVEKEEKIVLEEEVPSDEEKPKKKRGRKPKVEVVAEETSN